MTDAPISAGSSRPPIFLVGVARSGTTLLATMLSAHPGLDCGPESRFFYGLRPKQLAAVLADPAWPALAVRAIAGLVTAQQSVLAAFDVSEADVHAYLAARKPSVPALLESLTVPHALRAGKPRWVEKSTDHLVRTAEIRAAWPAAPIIRIVRDPRDVALSLRGIRFGRHSFLANLEFWRKRDAASWRFFERDRGSLTVRYEDLLRDPRAVLEQVCAHIGEPFDPGMLADRERAAETIKAPGERYKGSVGQALDASRIEVWQRELEAPQQAAAAVYCHAGIARYGYPEPVSPVASIGVQPWSLATIERHEAALTEILGARVQVGELRPRSVRRSGAGGMVPVIWARSGELAHRADRSSARRQAAVLALLARLRLRGATPLWVDEPSTEASETTRSPLLERSLRLLSRRVAASAIPSLVLPPASGTAA